MSNSEIENWWQLQQLMTRYVTACDERDWQLYRSLFTLDAIVDYTEGYGRAGSVDEIVPWLEKILDPAIIASTQHLLANLQVEVKGELARGQAHCFNPDVIIEGGQRRALINGGIYTFDARKDGEGWHLTSLKMKVLWSTRAELSTYETPA